MLRLFALAILVGLSDAGHRHNFATLIKIGEWDADVLRSFKVRNSRTDIKPNEFFEAKPNIGNPSTKPVTITVNRGDTLTLKVEIGGNKVTKEYTIPQSRSGSGSAHAVYSPSSVSNMELITFNDNLKVAVMLTSVHHRLVIRKIQNELNTAAKKVFADYASKPELDDQVKSVLTKTWKDTYASVKAKSKNGLHVVFLNDHMGSGHSVQVKFPFLGEEQRSSKSLTTNANFFGIWVSPKDFPAKVSVGSHELQISRADAKSYKVNGNSTDSHHIFAAAFASWGEYEYFWRQVQHGRELAVHPYWENEAWKQDALEVLVGEAKEGGKKRREAAKAAGESLSSEDKSEHSKKIAIIIIIIVIVLGLVAAMCWWKSSDEDDGDSESENSIGATMAQGNTVNPTVKPTSSAKTAASDAKSQVSSRAGSSRGKNNDVVLV